MRTLIRVIVLVLIVMWVYGIFSYKPSVSSVVDDPCKSNSSVNPCIVISTDGFYER